MHATTIFARFFVRKGGVLFSFLFLPSSLVSTSRSVPRETCNTEPASQSFFFADFNFLRLRPRASSTRRRRLLPEGVVLAGVPGCIGTGSCAAVMADGAPSLPTPALRSRVRTPRRARARASPSLARFIPPRRVGASRSRIRVFSTPGTPAFRRNHRGDAPRARLPLPSRRRCRDPSRLGLACFPRLARRALLSRTCFPRLDCCAGRCYTAATGPLARRQAFAMATHC